MSPAFSRIANESMPASFSSTPIAMPEKPLPTMTIGKSLMLADDAKTSPEPRRVDVDHAQAPAARRREAPGQDRLRGALRERRRAPRGRRAASVETAVDVLTGFATSLLESTREPARE